MAKPRKRAPRPAAKVPWYEHRLSLSLKAGWLALCAVLGALGALILEGPTLLENLQKLPAEFSDTVGKFQSWWYDDADWTGNWSDFPEGIVDMADMHLSDTDLKVTIWAKQGQLEGTIENAKVCQVSFDYLLLSGSVSGNTSDVMVWDFRDGHRLRFAQLTFSRNDDTLTIKKTLDPAGLFSEDAVRIGRHPATDDKEPEPQRCAFPPSFLLPKQERSDSPAQP
jgi:hypothetical protein